MVFWSKIKWIPEIFVQNLNISENPNFFSYFLSQNAIKFHYFQRKTEKSIQTPKWMSFSWFALDVSEVRITPKFSIDWHFSLSFVCFSRSPAEWRLRLHVCLIRMKWLSTDLNGVKEMEYRHYAYIDMNENYFTIESDVCTSD